MKKFLFSAVLYSAFAFSQEKTDNRLGFFGTAQADLGVDLGSVISPKKNIIDPNYRYYRQQPTYFTYGFSAQAGIQPLNWFALSGGLRYSYISPKFHNIYWMVQPYFIVTPSEDKDFGFITIDFGKQLNSTQGRSGNGFVGIGVGKMDLLGPRFAQKLQINLDVQTTNEDAVWFVGLSYGIVVFSNKEL